MAPAYLLIIRIDACNVSAAPIGASAWETQASGRQGRFGAKSAPQHRDFAPEKEEVI